jgi:hypothetical protein
MGDTVIETVMEDMVADHEKMTHAKDSTRAMVTKRILASCDDIRCSRTLFGLSCGGFLEYSVFLPFITRGKPFFDAISTQGSIRSPHLSPLRRYYSHRTQTAFQFHHGNTDSSTLWFPSSGLRLYRNLESQFSRLDLLALGEHILALILEVKVRGKAVVPSDHLTSVLKNSCLYYQNCRRTAGGKNRSLRLQNCSFDFP